MFGKKKQTKEGGGKGARRWVRPWKRRGLFFLPFLIFFFVFGYLSSSKVAEAQILWLTCLLRGGFPCFVTDVGAIAMEEENVASETVNFLEKAAKYTKMIDDWTGIADTFKDVFPKWQKMKEEDAAVNIAGRQAVARAWGEVTQRRIDASVQDVQLRAAMDIAANNPQPQDSEQFVCNKIKVCQGPVFMADFARGISRVVGDGISQRYRDAMDDGNGPQYIRDQIIYLFGGGPEGTKYANYLDGCPDGGGKCYDSPSATMGGFASADTSRVILNWESELQVPPMKKTEEKVNGKTIEVIEPDIKAGSQEERDIAQKKAWFAAVRYCYKIAGPRPTPPTKEAMDTPEGRVRRAQWEYCAAQQDHFVRMCTDRVGKLSRPDCKGSDYKDLCEASKKVCEAARDARIPLPPSLKECDGGISLYQAEYLCNRLCGSSRQYQAGATAGAADKEQMRNLALCSVVGNTWKRQLLREDEALDEAMTAMSVLDRCWNGAPEPP